MKKKLTILFILLVILAIPAYFWWQQALKPVNPQNTEAVDFVIETGEDVRSISNRLEREGIIRSGLAFFLKARFSSFGKDIQAGDFSLSPSMNLNMVTEQLKHGTNDITLTIPEGWRKEEIATKVASEFNIPESEFLKNAREGYLFPDTYFLPKDATAGDIVKVMNDNFDRKTKALNTTSLKKHNLTLDQAIIIASLVEREAKIPADRPLIASVILNRLSLDMKLDIDATVQYALGYQPKEKSWWKKDLTEEDLSFDSPYNTYQNKGLPPGPIANPGISSIDAVFSAPGTDYLYYVADSSGRHHFAKTFEEHAANISRYLDK